MLQSTACLSATDCLAAGTTGTTVSDVVPAKGELLHSTDGGHTWVPSTATLPVDDVYGLACPSADQCAMVGTTWAGFPAVGTGGVAESTDAGLTFRELSDVLRPHHPDRGGLPVGLRVRRRRGGHRGQAHAPPPGQTRTSVLTERWLPVRRRIPGQRGDTPVDSWGGTSCAVEACGGTRTPSPERWRTVMPKTCPQCQSGASDDAEFCANCGAALSGDLDGHPGASRPELPPARPRRSGRLRCAAASARRAGLQVRRRPLDTG